jgi:hypothetical protein
MQQPSVGRIVHYVSYGTPGGEYGQACRAATITEVDEDGSTVGLCVTNPTGLFFDQHVPHHDGAEQPGAPDCPQAESHGNPHRYCACGWTEAHYASDITVGNQKGMMAGRDCCARFCH